MSGPQRAIAKAILALVIGAPIVGPSPALAQQARQSNQPTGRGFAGLDLPVFPERGEISFRAVRAWTWREAGADRLVLDRDVRIKLGPYELTARRAVVWLEPVTINGVLADQVAVYLDRATSAVDQGDGFSQSADRLLVTGIIINTGAKLRTDLIESSRPALALLDDAEARLARYLATLAPPQSSSRRDRPAERDLLAWLPPDDRPPAPPAKRPPLEPPSEGVLSFSPGGDVVIRHVEGGESWAIMLTGEVAVQYNRVAPSGIIGGAAGARTVQLSAQRAVVFLQGATQPGQSRYELTEIEGVYLEGDVQASSGDYTLRGNRIYYDVNTEQAIVLDGVFWTYDENRGMPLYMRADVIRQEAQNQWSAQKVQIANVAFAEPQFSIGVREVTLTRVPADPQSGQGPRQYFDAKGVAVKAGNVSMLGWPRMRGEFRPTPLRGLTVGSSGGDPVVRTTWDLYTLLGLDPAKGNSASLLLDGYVDRGPAVGTELEWSTPDINGSLTSYYIFDNGTDRLPSGTDINQENENRGLILAEQVWRLNDNWTLFLEGAYISDETFVPAFFRDEAERRREFTNSFYARYLDERSALTIEARGSVNDFVANEYLFQSLGYQTQQTPDIAYRRFNDPLFGGLLSYSSEYRYSRAHLNFNEPTMRSMGFEKLDQSLAAFGLGPGQSIGDALRASGFNEQQINRFDTRHEIEMPLQAGPLSIVPFAAGRLTLYDTSFSEFTSALGASDDNDRLRQWGSIGVRLATTIQRVDTSVESKRFDLHHMRHLIEPSATFWTSDTNVEQQFLPIYDEEVESITDGSAVRLGLRNTWQTKRGGDGQWRSVDWLTIDTEYVYASSDVDQESPLGRFVSSRPERSNLGRFINNDAVMLLTDAVALSNNLLVDYNEGLLMRSSFGAIIDHGEGFSSLFEYRYMRIPQGEFLDVGASYELTRRYASSVIATYNADRGELQDITAQIIRRSPQLTVEVGFNFDNISGDVSLGLSLRPVGLGRERRTRVFTRDLFDRTMSQPQPIDGNRLKSGPFAGG